MDGGEKPCYAETVKILQIEPSQLFQKIIREIFIERGQEVIQVSTVEEAAAALDDSVLMILMSMELGRTPEGKPAAESFLKSLGSNQKKSIPVIVITSSESLEIRQRYFDLGVTDFVLKKDLNYDSFNRYLERFSREDPLKERLRSVNIGVLEDNRMEMNIIRNIFLLNGIHHAEFFTHPRDLIESEKTFDILICDVILPDMKGEDVVRIMRQKYPRSAILVISALNKYKAIAPVLDAGAQDYIAKPFLPDVFMLRLRSAVKDLAVLELLEEHGIDTRGLLY